MLELIRETDVDEPLVESPFDVSHIMTEDDDQVDNLFSEKQQRLTVQSLYASDILPRPFVAAANVGVFRDPYIPPVVPDVFLSLGVEIAENWYAKEHRTYFVWEFGKPPDVVMEIVSNKKGGELEKRPKYAQIGVQYYIIYDPQQHILNVPIQVYELIGDEYHLKSDSVLDDIGIEIRLWNGVFEDRDGEWLRWYAVDGDMMLLTGDEQAEIERRNAQRERERAERLAEHLRQLGIDPDQL